MTRRNGYRWICLSLLLTLLTLPAAAQEMRATLFTDVDAKLAEAMKMQVDVLAPRSYAEFRRYYDRAEANLAKGQQIEKIKDDVGKATASLDTAMEATKLATVTFGGVMEARADAATAEASTYAAQLWTDAEKKFSDAAGALEGGDVNAAKNRATEAELMYRNSELAAIETNYFEETRTLLAAAEKAKVGKYAPLTLQRSKDLLAQAEQLLGQDRYDTDHPRSLAREAKYEVKHATQMADVLLQIDKKQMTTESLLLGAEGFFGKVAGQLDVVPMFDEGYGPTTDAVLHKIDDLDHERNRLEAKVTDYEEVSKGMKEQIASLESELGGVSEEREAMQARMDAEAKVRAQFAQVESLFTRQEAQVYRQGNTVLIRMLGLNFDFGKATINSDNFPLLTKVQNAINIFPGSNVSIEGYTDSYGSDDTNQVLSQQRADAVREYLLANMGLSPASIQAVGYGESNPLASNETPEGRLKNRRIDLTIQPNLGDPSAGAIAD